MNVLEQYHVRGRGSAEIAASIEVAVREDRLGPGTHLPTVRDLAGELGVSPATVAAAYAALRRRGVVTASGRRGTQVADRPPLPVRPAPPLPAGVHDLATGNPDPALLPAVGPVLPRLDLGARLYDERPDLPALVETASAQLAGDGVPAGPVAVVSGAMDGVERVLATHLRPGDRVAVEDPGYPQVFDLVAALGLVAEPVRLDRGGPLPGVLDRALGRRAAAAVLTPRAQNPTGAALGAERAAELRQVLDGHPGTLVVEDDHAGTVAGAPYRSLCQGRPRWAVVRSVSKALGPDLRVAVVTGDPDTIGRVEGRQLLGPGWVSHVLQGIVAELWTDQGTAGALERAAAAYADRRATLVGALARHGIAGQGDSGLNVWVPVPEEAGTVALLLEAGWAVAAGERYRLRSGPAVRITVATLRDPAEADRLAATLAAAVEPRRRTRSA
ncbi:MAG TPA: aminotransferase class I/II-fold pyridoxal phosphate-dependent enzyme [Actinomycetes bacterium]|jgi:DNA-binding transcriptional MocR family regulator|nr:aminotransferase class I/II-fold pyridoxal phosphate-dependent enzyme [Actinomycetes bacterium]